MSKLELIQDIENKAEKSYVDTLPTADKIPSLAFSNQIYKQNESLNQDLVAGMYDFYNATDGFPDGYTTENDFYLFVTAISPTESSFQRHILLDVRDNRTFSRSKRNGELTPWKEMATKDDVASLSVHRGYERTPFMNDFNGTVESGKYKGYDSLNAPMQGATILLDVTRTNDEVMCQQTARIVFGGDADLDKTFTRVKKVDETWTPWKQLATTDAIEDLSRHFYFSFAEINNGLTVDSHIVDVVSNMRNFSTAIIGIAGANTRYPEAYGTLEIIRLEDSYRTSIRFYGSTSKKSYYAIVHTTHEDGWSGWQEVATTDRLADLPLLNGWTLWGGSAYPPKVFKVGNICSITGCIVGGTATSGTTIFTLPEGFRPKRTESTPVLGADGKVYNLNISLNGNANTDNSWGTTWTNSLKMINIVFEV